MGKRRSNPSESTIHNYSDNFLTNPKKQKHFEKCFPNFRFQIQPEQKIYHFKTNLAKMKMWDTDQALSLQKARQKKHLSPDTVFL